MPESLWNPKTSELPMTSFKNGSEVSVPGAPSPRFPYRPPPVATLSWGMRVHARGKKRKQREARKGEAAGRGDAPRACCARPAALAHGATHRPSEPSRRDGALCSLPRSRSLGCKPTLCEGREGRRRRRRWAPERRRAATARTAAGAGERRARRRRRARRGRSTAAAAARAS